MSQTLAQICVLVTRPDPAGSELCAHINAQHGIAIHFPVIDFAPPPDEMAFTQSINAIGQQDWLIFTSPHAVFASVPALRRAWPELPPQVKFAAVGAGTANALHAAGYVTALQPLTDWSSEGLLALPAFQTIHGMKIAIIRGVGGRTTLTEELTARGANILPVIAYQRVMPQLDTHILKDSKINVVVCTSFEGINNLKTLAGEYWEKIQRMPLIVVSERIKKLAQNLDFQPIWVAKNASHTAILEILAQKREEICQIQLMNQL